MQQKRSVFFGILIWVVSPVWAVSDSHTIEIPAVSLMASDTAYQTDLSSGQTKSLNRKDIQKNVPLNLSELLSKQSTVRVNLNSGNSSQYGLSMRGFGDNAPANSLILIDGFPLMNASLLAPELNSILLSDIESIQIFQGSEGSLWGNQAVGGVLNIETRLPQKPYGNVELAYGNHDQVFASGIYGNQWNSHFMTKISGLSNSTDNERMHDRYQHEQASADEIYRYQTGLFQFIERIYDDAQDLPGGLSLSQFERNPNKSNDLQDYINTHAQIYQLLNQQTLNQYWTVETRFSHAQVVRNGFYFSPFTENQFTNWFNPKLIGNFQHTQWIIGGVLQNNGYESISTPDVTDLADANEQDFYGQLKYTIKNWELTVGSRFARQASRPQIVIGEPFEYNDHVFVSEEGLSYKINSFWKAFLRRDGNFRFPKANEEVWLANNVMRLRPQTGASYETGLDYQIFKQHFQLSLYELQLKNEIAYDPTLTPEQPFGATHNFDPTSRKGVSIMDEIALTQKLNLYSGLDFVDARFRSGPYVGKDIPGVPAWNANAGLSVQLSPHWKTAYQEYYNGSAYASDDVLNTGRKAFVYWLGDWSVEYSQKKMRVAFKIKNIFNHHYAQYTAYNQFTQSNLYYPGGGRTVMVSLNFDLC